MERNLKTLSATRFVNHCSRSEQRLALQFAEFGIPSQRSIRTVSKPLNQGRQTGFEISHAQVTREKLEFNLSGRNVKQQCETCVLML